MALKQEIPEWVVAALKARGGRSSLVAVAKEIWAQHELDLRASGDLFFTWQYDMRWAANVLRRKGVMKSAEASPSGIWELAED